MIPPTPSSRLNLPAHAMNTATQVCDFNRSFVRFGLDTKILKPVTVSHPPPFTLNHVRVRAECLAEVTDRASGKTASYLLGASCKTEQVNVPSGIWTEPNADMCLAGGPDHFLVIKSWDRNNKGVMLFPPSLGPQPERQLEQVAKGFTHYAMDIRKTAGRVITDVDELGRIFASDQHVVCRTRIEAPQYALVLEYPSVTSNYGTREHFYQVDTGPVLFPDLQVKPADFLGSCRLAFVAHNARDWAEFLVSVPTPVGGGISVNHYSRSVRVDCVNEMIAVG